jgi:hypothetical protein
MNAARILGCVSVTAFWLAGLGCTSGATKAPGVTTYTVGDPPSSTPILDAGDEPAVPPNGAASCPPGVCNYQTQSGCVFSEAAPPACLPLTTSEGTAVPVCVRAGTALEGEECVHWDDCAAGLACAGRDKRICRRMCCGGDWSACRPDERCTGPFWVNAGSTPVPSGASVCMPAQQCDVLTGSPCPAGNVCQIVDPTGATACVEAPPQGLGGRPADPCPPCQTGFACIGQGCARLCGLAEAGPFCPPEEGRCVHWNRDPEGVGECTPVF